MTLRLKKQSYWKNDNCFQVRDINEKAIIVSLEMQDENGTWVDIPILEIWEG